MEFIEQMQSFAPHYFDGSHFLFHVMAAAKKAAKTTSGNA